MKKVIKSVIVILVLICIIIGIRIYNMNIQNKIEGVKYNQNYQVKNEIYKVDKIVAYSSANATNTGSLNNAYWKLNVMQFTDFAVFIKTNQNVFENEKNIKDISIENIKLDKEPMIGTVRIL